MLVFSSDITAQLAANVAFEILSLLAVARLESRAAARELPSETGKESR